MTHGEIRQKFLEYFKRNGHVVVPSSSLVPSDLSVLLTTAGMQQFKPYYTGEADAQKDFGAPSVASIQKCFRTSDIDEVGDETHLTFFEMAGNFSFGYKPYEPRSSKGGYFKDEAIKLAHGFLTQELGLAISYVTVFEGSSSVPKDTESRKIWNELGISDVREEGMDSVFWGPTGSSGPCGPTTEIYCQNASLQDVEVWNIVFNEYFCAGSREELATGKAELKPLTPKGIDTGMGLERLAMIAQKTKNIFETDLFAPLFAKLPTEIDEKIKRIIVDHTRASVFLICDGVRPANKGTGYILRRLLRRVIFYQQMAYKKNIKIDLFDIVEIIVGEYGQVYDNLDIKIAEEVLMDEAQKFTKTIDRGARELEKLTAVDAAAAFKLFETFGLPYEIIKEIGGARAEKLTRADFDAEFAKHQAISRAGAEKKFGGHGLILDTGELKASTPEEVTRATKLHTATHLLQAALRKVLGPEIHQLGSDITFARLRFDFNFSRKLTDEEARLTEEFINSVIARDLSVTMKEEDYDTAVKEGALAFFRAKYPARVKVYRIGDVSMELCGGPHVARTGEIGKFKIIKDEAVASGIRRIRATIK
jgi:alanyl-tRNA synthetase